MTNIFFNHFENSYIIDFFKLLHSEYKFFNRFFIVEKLLNETYKSIKFNVMKRLNICNYFNFFINKIINIRKKRIVNLCCYILSNNEFHIKIIFNFVEKITAVI